MLVGNQCDKSYEREVSHQEGIALAQMFGCEFMETSARTAYNVELLFTNVVRALRQTGLHSIASTPQKNNKRPIKCIIM